MAHRRSVYVKRNNRTTTDTARRFHPNRTARNVFPVTTFGLGDEVSVWTYVSFLFLYLLAISFCVFSKERFS